MYVRVYVCAQNHTKEFFLLMLLKPCVGDQNLNFAWVHGNFETLAQLYREITVITTPIKNAIRYKMLRFVMCDVVHVTVIPYALCPSGILKAPTVSNNGTVEDHIYLTLSLPKHTFEKA